MSRILRVAAALVVTALGFGCLNYTVFSNVEHHREWAAESGFPAPAAWIFDVGLVAFALGAGALGHALGARRRRA